MNSLTALIEALKCGFFSLFSVYQQRTASDVSNGYRAAAGEFTQLQESLVKGNLTGQFLTTAQGLWRTMEEANTNARRYGVAVTFEGQTHPERFDDVRTAIIRALERPAYVENVDEEGDVTEVDSTGFTNDAGPADDWEDK